MLRLEVGLEGCAVEVSPVEGALVAMLLWLAGCGCAGLCMWGGCVGGLLWLWRRGCGGCAGETAGGRRGRGSGWALSFALGVLSFETVTVATIMSGKLEFQTGE